MRFRDGQWHQCRRAASWRLGARTCGVHGGGYFVRVARGQRQNPVTASLVHGRRATAVTLDAALQNPVTERLVAGAFFSQEMRRIEKTVALKAKRLKHELATRKRGRPSRADVEERQVRRAHELIDEAFARATRGRTGGA